MWCAAVVAEPVPVGRRWSGDGRGAIVRGSASLLRAALEAVGESQIAQFIEDDKLGAGIATDDATELAAAVGFLELVGEPGERGEAHSSSLVAGADRERGSQVRFAGSRVADEDDRLAVVDP